ncbi:AraC family transcriptional regulator [Aquimarina sp. ERC-38]|uniref:helix-turn-helix transcriptional regulator n=1 Tax=Aquimarina sp. ERC-38 TaxID=2949996 RepID=UPI0022484568|nr:AraC family transcriptional regulator [Aquimarina sp. ERC-38]UZO80846.1 AraC family transcriptional regulator [Aquimarina sp. ERC-38]
MLILNESDIIGLLENISKDLGGTFEKSFGAATLKINNEKGKGVIKAYDLFPGLNAVTYDITLFSSFSFELKGSTQMPLYFIFCKEGNFKHKFETDDDYTLIENQKNSIVRDVPNGSNTVVLPEHVPLQISIISISETEVSKRESDERRALSHYLEDLFKDMVEEKPYRFTGHFNLKIAGLVEMLIKNDKKGVVSRILSEGLIMQILSSQIENHDQETEDTNLNAPLKSFEMDKIIESSQYIVENMSKPISIFTLTNLTSLSEKKLQSGYRYLFHKSINKYILEVRLEKTRELIETTDFTISEILYSCGLNNRSYFSKKFKERYGILPSDYRILLKSKS